jgi:hypothetical protein
VFTGNGKRVPLTRNKKEKKFNKKLDNIKKLLTFAVPTNRESPNGC